MAVFEFTLVLPKECFEDYDGAEAGFSKRCLDATFYATGGVSYLGFNREADSLEEAIQSAIADVRAAGYCVIRIQTDESQVVEQFNATLADAG